MKWNPETDFKKQNQPSRLLMKDHGRVTVPSSRTAFVDGGLADHSNESVMNESVISESVTNESVINESVISESVMLVGKHHQITVDENNRMCDICRELSCIPHSLPCVHYFCYECILRHLSKFSNCPKCNKGPFNICDLSTDCKKLSKAPQKLFFKRTEPNYRRFLREFGLGNACTVEGLVWRYQEIFFLMMKEQFCEKRSRIEEIAEIILRKEGQMKREKKSLDMRRVYESLMEIKKRFMSL